MRKTKAPIVGLTFGGRRHIIGPTTAKILKQGATIPPKQITSGLLGAEYQHRAKDILSSRFLVPPFTVLSSREGFWQERKRQWIDIGIQSELGRGYTAEAAAYGGHLGKSGDLNARYKNTTMSKKYEDGRGGGLLRPPKMDLRPRFKDSSPGGSPRPAMSGRKWGDPIKRGDSHGRPLIRSQTNASPMSDGTLNNLDVYRQTGAPGPDPVGGTSVFDPVLCELIYRWFCPPDARILDPFAGGSVRGIVAGEMGHHYYGIDLSTRQLDANRKQAQNIGTHPAPVWINGDSNDAQELLMGEDKFDLLFSCPPYGDLERYSDDPRDLSTLELAAFRSKYASIIEQCCGLLKPDAFACFVVGDYRSQDGFYCNLPGETIAAFERSGLRLYNYAILVNVTGSLPLRINTQFVGSRKLGKTHQDVLVFAKGQPKEFVKTWNNTE